MDKLTRGKTNNRKEAEEKQCTLYVVSYAHAQTCRVNTKLTWDTWEASSKKRFISSSPCATFMAEPLMRGRERERMVQRGEVKCHKRGKDATKKWKTTRKLQNTHYFCIASEPPLGTRSGNGRNKRNGEKWRQYLGQKALRALENEFRI